MNRSFSLLIFISIMSFSCKPEASDYSSFEEYPVYEGEDLGLTYTPSQAVYRIYSPAAEAVRIMLYEDGDGGEPLTTKSMSRGSEGVWEAVFDENLNGRYYTFQAQIAGEWGAEVPDPYVRAVGVNGRRGMVVDLRETDPAGWEEDRRPPLEHFNDIVIYELHVRDASIHPGSGIEHKGKYLGLAERGTATQEGLSTGLDHIRELGVTHVHLLPVFDYRSIDESQTPQTRFNWGYDPQNYNVPEGTYATDPYDGRVRIREFKQMVKAFHDAGLRVVMDVVYNHTGETEGSNFNQLAPGYYYRQRDDGSFSDASACGNETASERPMMRKFIVESVSYWAKEYHIDGFRFDLMGIHDIETMNQVSAALHRIDPTIFIYGEGWTAGDSPLPEADRALKKHTYRLNKVAAFSDDMRDAIKGHVFTHDAPGFASGKEGLAESVRFGTVASTQHPQVNYDSVNYSDGPWAAEPFQTITYCSCHDNHTLWDRLSISRPDASEAERIRMHKLALTMVLTAQGVSFLHAGTELLRTKNGVENSFESPDSINQIDWSRKGRYPEVFQYVKDLISLRKAHPAFRMTSAAQIREHLRFLDAGDELLVAYLIEGNANGDDWEDILIIYNGHRTDQEISLPEGNWTMVLDENRIDEAGIKQINAKMKIAASSAVILVKNSENGDS